MALKEGDVVQFDYVLYADGDKKPLETNIQSVAEEHGQHEEGRHYHPLTVTIGGRQIIPGLEEIVTKKAKQGASFSVELPAEKAYGDRDAKKIQDVPMAQFRKEKVKPEVGLILNFQGQRAVITRVAGGRVRLDMNHDLAGKDLRYDITVTKIITDTDGKVTAVLDDFFHHAEYKVDISDDRIDIELPDQAKFDQNWTQAKFRIIMAVRQAAGLEREIRLIESYPPMGEAAAAQERAEPAESADEDESD